METTIPFCGFYCSEFSEVIDSAIEDYFTDDWGTVNSSIAEKVFDNTDYKGLYSQAAKLYTEHLANELQLALTFKELVSPRYYNFETDRIFCDIDLSEVERLYAAINQSVLAELVRQHFTSYDGFISHYSNNLGDWGTDLSEWDHNQIGTLVSAYIIQENGGRPYLDYYDLRSAIGSIVPEYIKDFDRYSTLAKYLNDREIRA